MRKYFTLKTIAGIAIFTALAAILYCVPGFQFHPGFTPPFMKLHFDEIPVLISSFAYGPVAGVLVLFLKSLIKLPSDISSTYGIGVLADFLYSLFLILPASIIYKKNRTFKGAIVGIAIGFLANIFVSSVVGLYVIFPLYDAVLGGVVVGLFHDIDNTITSLYSFKISYEFLLPFNLIRASIVCAVTLLTYKPLKNLINRDYN